MDLFREETAQAGSAKTSARQARSHASRSKPAAKETPAPDAEVAQPSPAVAASKTPAAPARRRETAETMGARAAKLVRKEFNLEITVTRYAALYEEVADRPSRNKLQEIKDRLERELYPALGSGGMR